ncbi:MAG: CRISPR system precrRNA processing endoribonuclease RAMP protein Cas6 [Candidatus Hodarchaeota archaeon]
MDIYWLKIDMLKLIFELYPEDGQIKSHSHLYGYIFRAVIMKWLSECKPELIHELHSYDKIRPYSIKCILNKKTPKVNFEVISYSDELSDTLFQDILSKEKIKLNIGQKSFYISKINFERISLKTLIETSKAVKDFNLKFITPVYFNTIRGDYPLRFPIPEILFGNLTTIWNDLFKEKSEIDREQFLSWVNAHIYISSYRMKTVKSEIGKDKPVVGGLGNVSYRLTKINKNYYKHYLEVMDKKQDFDFVIEDYKINSRWLDILCKFGEYTNVGANRTAGLGAFFYYPKNYIPDKDLLIK